jgi:hypothetical protein
VTAATKTAPLHPRHDPTFPDRLVNDLIQHFGQWRNLGKLYAAHVESYERGCIVRDVIDAARRVGLIIEGDNRLGYRLTGYRGFRYIRTASALCWPAEHRPGETLPGQMDLGIE